MEKLLHVLPNICAKILHSSKVSQSGIYKTRNSAFSTPISSSNSSIVRTNGIEENKKPSAMNSPKKTICNFFTLLGMLIMLTGFAGYRANAQSVGISSSAITPDASSILEMRTSTKGLLIPRLTTTERNAISSPATGLMIYNTTTSKFNYYDGGAWTVLFAGSSGVNSVTGTNNRISIGGTSSDPTVDISSSYVGQSSITTLGTIGSGTWNGSIISPTYGGTGINNGNSTITLGGNLVTSGAFATTLTSTATTNATLPAGTNTLYSTKSASIASSQLLTSLSDPTGTGVAVFGTSPTLATPVINGLPTGTGVASAATASTLVSRDANANIAVNNSNRGYTTTATAAGTTTLTVGSTYFQYFTGSTTQTLTLPVASTLVLGQQFMIVNNSTGVVTVQSSGGNSIQAMAAGTNLTVTCILTSGTGTASWSAYYPTSGTVTSVSGTTNRVTVATGTTTPVIDIASNYVGQNTITTLGTIGTGTWNGTLVDPTYGGTGVNNGSSTITLGGNLVTSGAFATTLTSTATTNATLPAGTNTLYSTKSASISSSQLLTSLSDPTGTGLAVFGTSPTLATPVINGLATGTGVASAATASTLVSRDANANIAVNNSNRGYTTTATAAGTTTLTVGSTYFQYFTGSTTQTVTLPVASTLVLGQQFVIVNNSSGIVTVQSSGANTIQAMAAGTNLTVTCILTSGTGTASWSAYYPTSGTVTSVSGTANRVTVATGTTTPVIDIASNYVGQNTITTLGTIGTGTWNGSLLTGTYGGTGVNNGSSTITLGGNLITSGAFATTLTSTATTNATLPAGTNTLYSTKSASITSSQLLTSLSDPTGTGVAVFGTTPTLATPVINGLATGTGVASAATASTLATRDANANISANNALLGYTTTATAAGTTTLTVGSTYAQYFTGSTTQTVTLPVASTLVLGQQFVIVNNSTGIVTVQSSGGNTIQAMAASTNLTVTCILTSGTGTSSWSAAYTPGGLSTNTANTLVLRDGSGNFSAGTITATFSGSLTGTATKATNLVGGNATTLLGSLPYQSNTDVTTLLSPNTTTTKKFLNQTGDGTNGAAPAWGTIAAGDVPTLNQNTTGSAATLTTPRAIYGNNFDGSAALSQIIASTYGGTGNGFTKFSGPTTSEKTFTLPNASATILTDNAAVTAAQGGTGNASYTVGDMLYASASTTLSKLAAVASGSYLRSAGTSTAPVWSTTTLPNSATTGDLLYASTSNSYSNLAGVATGNALISGGTSTAPSWGKIGLTTHVTGTLPIANGGTNSTATPTNGGVAYGDGSAYQFSSAGTTGQILQSAGAAAPVWIDGGAMMSGVSNNTAVNNTTLFFPVTGAIAGNATDAQAGLRSLVSRAGTIKNLYVKISAALPSGKTGTVTVYKNGVATALVATLSVGPTLFSDTVNSFTVAAGDEVGIQVSTTGNVKFSWAVSFTY